MRQTIQFPLVGFILLAFVATTLGSSGDRAQEFQSCIRQCENRSCLQASELSLSLRLTRWTCLDDCKYKCMHYITDLAEQAGVPVQQYYGKWPFWRYAGMQEPASVIFSIFNLLFHWHGLELILSRVPNGHPMKGYYTTFAFISMNAWVWSSVFHTRDLHTTEKLDYFSAALAIMYAFYYTVVRLFHLYDAPNLQSWQVSRRQRLRKGLATTCTIAFLGHITYLTLLPRFDYTYNMIFNLVIGTSHNILWLLYALPSSISPLHRFTERSKSYRSSYTYKPAVFVLLTTAAMTLELFDFPPWHRTLDAHALWHLSTVPIIAFWYEFLIQDACDDGWKSKQELHW